MKQPHPVLYDIAIPPVPTLAATRCEACGTLGATVVVTGCHAGGTGNRAWCSIACAKRSGWPWLPAVASRVVLRGARRTD